MSEALARLHRLWPEFAGWSDYEGRRSLARVDPPARAAVSAALQHIEIQTDRFLGRDVIEQAERMAPADMTVFRIAADLQRLILQGCGVISLDGRLDGSGQILTTGTACGISAAIALEIDAVLGEEIVLVTREEALRRLAEVNDQRHVVLVPDRRAAREIASRHGVEAVGVGAWISTMDRALLDLETPEPLWRRLAGRTLLVDRAWAMPNVDIAVIVQLARRLCMELVLVDNPGRFAIAGRIVHVTYRCPASGRRSVTAKAAPLRRAG